MSRSSRALVLATAMLMPLTAVKAQSPAAPKADAEQPWPFIHLDLDAGVVDLPATVVMRQGEWLELLACSPGTREHESILTVPARPSHVHLALLALGLEPGDPLSYEDMGDHYEVYPPHGPEVEVFIVMRRDGRDVEIPANRWVVNQKTGQVMQGNHWLFTGSAFKTYKGKRYYLADLNGTVASLVNFGDDLLGRDTTVTNHSDNQAWAARTQVIPPLGTEVILRLRPVIEPALEPAKSADKTAPAADER